MDDRSTPITKSFKELSFQIIDWFIPKKRDKDLEEWEDNYDIHIYGVTEDSKTVMCVVEDFYPYFYVRCPSSMGPAEIDDHMKSLRTQLDNCNFEYNVVRTNNKTGKDTITKYKGLYKSQYNMLKSMDVVRKHDFWGYSECEKIFLKIVVKSESVFYTMQNIFKQYERNRIQKLKNDGKDCNDDNECWKLYESNCKPFLRFIHEKNIKPSGWVKVKGKNIERTDSNCNYSFRVNKDNIHAIDKSMIAPMLIASFDIECTSSHGDFPMAIKNYKKLAQDLCENVELVLRLNMSIVDMIKHISRDNLVLDHEQNIKIHRLMLKSMPTSKHYFNLKDNARRIRERLIHLTDKSIKQKDAENIENELIDIFDTCLPELYGDPIIQIGTTFHYYGSETIVYKHLISLRETDKIDGVDVIWCKNESDLILGWKDMIQQYNPDVITGYNILGFDFKYMKDRCIELEILDKFCENFGKSSNINSRFVEDTKYSSAMGEVSTYMFEFDGIVIVDLFVYVKKPGMLSLDSYKLDNVAEYILKEKKVDLKPNEIFSKYLGTSKDRADIGIYCIQDCVLVNRLIQKMKVIENNSGMSNVCMIPMSYIFHRGQGIKIFSLVLYECSKRGQVIPTREVTDDTGYEGAIVLEPKTGLYIDEPIVVFDYSSLYPSSMIAENLSHDSYILPCDIDKYLNVSDRQIFKDGSLDKIVNNIEIDGNFHYFVKYKDGRKSTIPQILEMLIKQRKATRSKIEYKNVYMKDGSMLSGLYKGDCVINIDTKESIRVDKDEVDKIEDTYNTFEQAVFDSLQLAYKITANSLYGQTGAKTSQIYLKPIAESTTKTGREMILYAKRQVEHEYNAEVIYGDSVMGYTPLTCVLNGNVEVFRFDEIDKMCDVRWKQYKEFKIGENDRTCKQQLLDVPLMVWSNKGWVKVRRVIRHKTCKKIYRVRTESSLVDVTEDHSLLDNHGELVKPGECMEGDRLLETDNISVSNDISAEHIRNIHNSLQDNEDGYIMFNNQKDAQINKLRLNSIGYNVIVDVWIDESGKKPREVYALRYNVESEREIGEIVSVDVLYDSYDGYVYDIETEIGVFHGGIGSLILKNTDSIFCKFPLSKSGKESVPEAISVGLDFEKYIAKKMEMYKPQALNYEKVLYPFILFAKKRYVGLLYEKDPNKCVEKSMGIVLKRRDNAKILKEVYGDVIKKILWETDLSGSFDVLDKWLRKIVEGEVDINKLIISKTLKSTYKNPDKIAHKVLADRIGARDPGNKPQINDRLPYLYIQTDNPKALQGDRIETPEYVLDNPDVKPDYLYYIKNQIMKPCQQLYALCVDRLPNYSYDSNYWVSMDRHLKTCNIYTDDEKRENRIMALKENVVKELLFDRYIQRFETVKKTAKDEVMVAELEEEIEITEKRCIM